MSLLTEKRSQMLNPIVTKFIHINTIFFNKATIALAPISSFDPNKGLTTKAVMRKSENMNMADAVDQTADLS